MYIADLHIHSRYSRATSRDCTPEILELVGEKKGNPAIGNRRFHSSGMEGRTEGKAGPCRGGPVHVKGGIPGTRSAHRRFGYSPDLW